MPSAVAFLPRSISEFVNFATSLSLNFGSGMILRLGTSRRRGMTDSSGRSGFRSLHAVLRALAIAVRFVRGARARSARGVECAANYVVTHARQILHAAAADEDD